MAEEQILDPASGAATGYTAEPEPAPGPVAMPAAPLPAAEEREDENPFAARLKKEPAKGDLSAGERMGLNATDSFYRGTIAGSGRLRQLDSLMKGEFDEPGDPVGNRKAELARASLFGRPMNAEQARKAGKEEIERIQTDLARYDAMSGYEGSLEGAVSLLGQIGGGVPSPESLINRVPGVPRVVGAIMGRFAGGVSERAISAGISQGVVNVASDPIVQANSIASGVQEGYEPTRTALAFPLGFGIGGGMHLGGEAVGALTRKPGNVAAAEMAPDRVPAPDPEVQRLDMAAQDPSARSADDTAALAVREAVPTRPAVDEPAPTARDAAAPVAAAEAAIKTPQQQPQAKATREQGGKPLSLSQFIARNGGLELSGEAAGLDLDKVFVPGAGRLARKTGRSIDGFWRERLIEEGYLPPDADGSAQRDIKNELLELLREEQSGRKHYSARDQERIPLASDEQSTQIDAAAESITTALKKSGWIDRDIDQRSLYDAAETLWRGEETSPELAYERAVMRRELDEPNAQAPHEHYKLDDDIPFRKAASPADGGAARDVRGQAGDGGRGGAGPRPEARSAGPGEQLPSARADGAQPRDTGARVGEGDLAFRRRGDVATGEAGAGTAKDPVASLQEQAIDLAEALDLPLRQGRTRGGKDVLGQYDTKQGVARTRSIADFETVAHEAGHAIEKQIGPELSALIKTFKAELGPLDYDGTKARPTEGFAEFVRQSLTAPAAALQSAPQFSAAFRDFLAAKAPETLKALDAAREVHAAWLNADDGTKLAAIVKRADEPGLWGDFKRAATDLDIAGMAKTVSLMVGKAYESIFDDKAVVTRAVRDIARLARDASGVRLDLQGADNPENLVRMFSRSMQAGTRDMLDGVRPYRGIAPEGPSLRDALILASNQGAVDRWTGRWDDAKIKSFSDYLVARRAEVLWQQFDAGAIPNRPIAMTKAGVANAVAQAEIANPSFKAAAEMVHDYTRQLLRKQFEGGLITREDFDKFTEQAFYVPLMRDMRDKPEAGGMGGGSRSEGPGKTQTIKRLKGSDRDVIDPIQSIMTQTFLVNRTLAHNDILKSFVALSRQAIGAGAVGVGRILEEVPAHEIVGKRFDLAETVRTAAKQNGIDELDTKALLGALSDTFGEDPIMGSFFRAEPTGKRGEPILFYKDGGALKAVRLIAKDEGIGLYEALAEMPAPMRDIAVKLGATSATVLRAGITTNPVFAVTNYVRDQMGAAILRPDYVPFDPRGVVNEIRQGDAAVLYGYAGGVSPGAGQVGLQDLVKQDLDALARKGYMVQKFAGLRDLVTKGDVAGGAKAVSEFVETAEAGTRLNVFKTVFDQKKRQGLSDYDAMIEAAAQATDLMDFGRHGSGTQIIRSLVPFLNAHLQGLDKGRRTLIEPLWRAARGDIVTEQDAAAVRNAGIGLFKMAGVGGALGTFYGLWASKFDGYQDASEELRASHLILPGAAFGMPGKLVVVPKPFELAMGFNLGELAGQYIGTGDARTAEFAKAGLAEVLVPPNVLNSIPVVKTFAELSLGKSFFTKRDIVPGELQKLPAAEQYSENTSNLARAIGKKIDVSPIKVDYAIGNAFGLWGKDLLAASNTRDPNAPEASLYNQMFLRRFIKNADSGSETTKKFWEQAATQNGTFAQAKNAFDRFATQFRDGEAAEFLGALPAPARAYVTLSSAVDPDTGKQAFTPDDRRIHPLTRAAMAVQTIGSMTKEMQSNAQRQIETGEKVDMDPTKRRVLIENLRVLAAMEQRNALIVMGEKGYEGRPLLKTEDQFAVLKALDPKAADELATRYATNKVAPIAAVAKAWPEAQKRLVADGGKADLVDLTGDVFADGYEFRAERVSKAKKRRLIIPGMVPATP